LTITDGVSARGIERATIEVSRRRYFITDFNGIVNIDKNLIIPGDSIKISCIGYKPVILLPVKNYKFPEIVKLSTLVTSLNEVRVRSLNTQEIKIGDIEKSYNTHRVPNPDDEYAQYIPNDKKIRGIITSVEYVLNDELHGIEKPFAVRLYSKNKNSLWPDKELIKDSLIVYNPKRKHLVSVDISRYNIQLPYNGIIVVFAALPRPYYGGDSVWYNKEPQGKRWFLKMPGLDMDLKKKDDYSTDYNRQNRSGPYSMVRPGADKWLFDDVKDQFYVFTDGNNFAISITVSPENP
jgi:hypothetical protein